LDIQQSFTHCCKVGKDSWPGLYERGKNRSAIENLYLGLWCMRKADISDKPIVLDILTRSFDGNKSVNYVVKQDRNRVDRIRKLMDYSFNVCNEIGEVWLSDDLEACALILFPDKKRLSFRAMLREIKLALSVIGISRVNAVLKREAMIKANHPQEPFVYLWFIGVAPQHQGKGLGCALMQEVIQLSEERKRSIYLETSVEGNLSFYKKLGFEIFRTLKLDYTLYQLRRA
jgi:ribosomal protein S18 acetylase RimI-like enzyme